MTGAAMKNRMLLIVSLAGGLMLSGGAAFGQDKPAEKTSTPEMVEGQVTNVDMNRGKLTIRATDGTMHEFEASKETLGDYKIGDPIKAKLRTKPQ
jgi:hypothetical protein